MAAAAPHETLFLGMTIAEVATVLGLFFGPIAAVIIGRTSESSRHRRDQRMQVLRGLISTFKLPADATWSVAMNMVLLEFHDHEPVMAARREYMNLVNIRPATGQEQAHDERIVVKQIALVYAVARALGFSISEGDLRTEVYISSGLVQRDARYQDSLLALREIATATALSAELAGKLVSALPGGGGAGQTRP